MNKCAYCDQPVEWKERSYICEGCFEERLKIKIKDPDRVVDDPHHSWF